MTVFVFFTNVLHMKESTRPGSCCRTPLCQSGGRKHIYIYIYNSRLKGIGEKDLYRDFHNNYFVMGLPLFSSQWVGTGP